MYKEQISLFDRLIAAGSYFSFGFIGFIWLIFIFFTKKTLSGFLQYHIYQSIFISLLYFIVANLLILLMQALSIIPFLSQIVNRLYFWFNLPVIGNFSLITGFIYIVLTYLIITSLMGKYSYLPWVSDIIGANTRR